MAHLYAYPHPLELDSDDEGSIGSEPPDNGSDFEDMEDVDSELASDMNSIDLESSPSNSPPAYQSPPPRYTSLPVCVVCRARPPYNKNGKSYPTCGLTCAAKLNVNGSPQPRTAQRPGGGSATSRNPFLQLAGSVSRSSIGQGQRSVPAHTIPDRVRLPPKPRCVICKARPCYRDFVTCGLKCAEKLCKDGGDSQMCNYCHRRPKNGDHPQCGQKCADLAKHACLLCRCRPRNQRYHLCGKSCKRIAVKATPLLLEAPRGHSTYEMVEKKFKRSWKSGSGVPMPEIKKVFKIIENDDFLRPYEAYRRRVGNEHFRYHGTSRQCTLGTQGNKLCSASNCAICNILRTSFKVSLARTSGAFGPGVYSSSAANKAFSYCGAGGAMLLTKVVLGNIRTVNGWNEVMSCPAGYNSVVFDRQNGALNETIVYTDDAIRPVFLIMF